MDGHDWLRTPRTVESLRCYEHRATVRANVCSKKVLFMRLVSILGRHFLAMRAFRRSLSDVDKTDHAVGEWPSRGVHSPE